MHKQDTILIVDDEVLIAQNLKETIEEVGYKKVLRVKSYAEALEKLMQEKIELVLLDINLKGIKTGVDLGSFINSEYKIPFIYITSYSDIDTIRSVKKTNPAGFLLKPYNKELLLITIEIALHKKASNNNAEGKGLISKYFKDDKPNMVVDKYFMFKDNYYFEKLLLNEILWFESDRNYVKIQTLYKSYTFRSSLIKLKEQLPSEIFIKCHKKYIININYVKSFNSNSVIIKDYNIPISRTSREEVINALKIADYI